MKSRPHTGASVPIAVKSVIKAARNHGMSNNEISMLCGISRASVKAVLDQVDSKASQIADAGADILKKELPRQLREAASLFLSRATQPELVAETSLRDLMVSLGIALDKACQLEQDGQNVNILVTIQNRVDQAYQGAIETNPVVRAIEAEDVEVQPCPPSPADNSAPTTRTSKPPAKPRPERAKKRVR